ncbi:hypothetical protein J4207_03050 [Candidatus Woesearchaeota archaeon]|nr:hypothetical protein [Candidatus Woesearchaeota archaeon]
MNRKGQIETITSREKKIYERIIEEATVDCNDEYEQISGWICLLDDNIATPCNCTIGKQNLVLEKIDNVVNTACIVGVIHFGKSKMRVLIQDIVLKDSTAMNYINAYKYWCKDG